MVMETGLYIKYNKNKHASLTKKCITQKQHKNSPRMRTDGRLFATDVCANFKVT